MLMPGEIIVDNFAGGGGASLGIEMALGRSPDIAVNHDAKAVALHAANHPATRHYCESVWTVDPVEACGGRPVGLAWFSPDCRHFSKAKGGQPVSPRVRGLAWVVVRWAKRVRPRVIILENVEEFQTWGPLGPDDKPIKAQMGATFRLWVNQLRGMGYAVDWRELRAADFGVPTIRKRLFLIARCDGRPIVWPTPTHAKGGAGGLLLWRGAHEILDWSLDCPSIFLTKEEARAIGCKRPLAEATMARIARGVRRFVLESAEPFIVPVTHAGDLRVHDAGEPLRTLTTARRGELALVAPYFVPRYGERPGQEPRSRSAEDPAATLVPTGNDGHLVAAFLAQHNTDMVGHRATEPVSTIVGKGCTQAVVSAGLLNLKGSDRRYTGPRDGVPTICAQGGHLAEVRAFLIKFYGTATGQDLFDPLHTDTVKPRFGLVTLFGQPYQLVDLGMRMLAIRERFRAQGFPDRYVITVELAGKPLTLEEQGRMVGNSVCPPLGAAVVAANFGVDLEARAVA